jgi:hypothetical protein
MSGAREIDIFEYTNKKGSVANTYISNMIQGAACNVSVQNARYWGTGGITAWHNYSVQFSGGMLTEYLDDTTLIQALPELGWANEDFAAVMNTAFGGTLGGTVSW